MNHETLYRRGSQIFAGAASALRANDWSRSQSDVVGLRYFVTSSVWGHWAACGLFLYEVSHHIGDETAKYSAYLMLLLPMMVFNGFMHHRLRTNRAFSWLWLRILYALDILLVSYWLATSGGFEHPFIYVFYYPVLAALAVFLAPFWHTLALVTAVAAAYAGINLTVGEGVDFAANDHETLLARIAVMYVVVVVVNVAATFERMRRRQAEEHERALERERMELSHTIHDTAAQSAYMIGLGIDSARILAGNANPELAATLEETSHMSRSILWELRHPINMGGIYEGRGIGRTLRSHATSFTNITGVPAELTQTGFEPELSTEKTSLLFSIAHNALTNAYRHAGACRVAVDLAFGEDDIRLSVSDDGTGLPGDYTERGSGFANMSGTAERLGGRLIVEERGVMGGASVTCVIPMQREREERRDGIG